MWATTFSLKQGETRTSHGPIPHPLRPLFHALFPKTAISEFFSSSRSYIRLKSQISGKFSFQSLKIEEKFSSYA